jgi:hypothetical protein
MRISVHETRLVEFVANVESLHLVLCARCVLDPQRVVVGDAENVLDVRLL